MSFQTQALVAALLLGATAAAAASPPNPGVKPVIGKPAWVRTPDGDELAHVFPRAAATAHVEGTARLRCKVSVDGSLYGCVTLQEAPLDWGFGEAALKLIPYFKMRPKTVDGVPVDGAVVVIPIRFKMDDTPSPKPDDPPPTIAEAQARDPEALALARQIAELTVAEDKVTGGVENAYQTWIYQLFDHKDAARSGPFLAAFRTAMDELTAERRDRVAAALVFTFNREDLKDIKTFLQTHAGTVFASEFPRALSRSYGRSDELLHAFVDAWQTDYCAKITCDDHDLNAFATLRNRLSARRPPPPAPPEPAPKGQ